MIASAVRASAKLGDWPPVRLWLRSDGKQVLVAVWDVRPEPPAGADETERSSAAEVTEERGWHKQGSGKTCWAVLAWNDLIAGPTSGGSQ